MHGTQLPLLHRPLLFVPHGVPSLAASSQKPLWHR
jgi:hypothetical protein